MLNPVVSKITTKLEKVGQVKGNAIVYLGIGSKIFTSANACHINQKWEEHASCSLGLLSLACLSNTQLVANAAIKVTTDDGFTFLLIRSSHSADMKPHFFAEPSSCIGSRPSVLNGFCCMESPWL